MRTASSKKPVRLVQSVQRALTIMDLLAEHPEGMGLRSLSSALDLAPQTVQSLLRTLQASHWVTQEGPGRPYEIGPSCARIAQSWQAGFDLGRSARPFVESLANETGEYVLLATLNQGTIVRIVEISVQRALMVHPRPEFRSSPHAMATGKLLIAYLNAKEQESLLEGIDFRHAKRGPRSPRSKKELRRQLRDIRDKGFAECIEENGQGIVALAVPVRDSRKIVVAALGLSLPTIRYIGNRPGEFRNILIETAGKIESCLSGCIARGKDN